MENNKFLFYKDKFNKIIFPDNFDNKIKNLIVNPFSMFKYLRKESDFNKWLRFLGPKCIELYINPISLSSEDFINLSKIIYNLIHIKEQNLKEPTYIKFINYCNKYNKLILDENNRINLKIKEIFPYLTNNLNLGLIAKHINVNNNFIQFNYDETDEEILKLKEELSFMTQKYLKYKKKYNSIKNNQLDYSSVK
jgi:hypothetical protein